MSSVLMENHARPFLSVVAFEWWLASFASMKTISEGRGLPFPSTKSTCRFKANVYPQVSHVHSPRVVDLIKERQGGKRDRCQVNTPLMYTWGAVINPRKQSESLRRDEATRSNRSGLVDVLWLIRSVCATQHTGSSRRQALQDGRKFSPLVKLFEPQIPILWRTG